MSRSSAHAPSLRKLFRPASTQLEVALRSLLHSIRRPLFFLASHVMRPLQGRKFAETIQQAVYLSGRVVVHQPDAQHAAEFFHAEALGKIQRIEISVPGE